MSRHAVLTAYSVRRQILAVAKATVRSVPRVRWAELVFAEHGPVLIVNVRVAWWQWCALGLWHLWVRHQLIRALCRDLEQSTSMVWTAGSLSVWVL
jgi:hypothetical protein